MKARICSAGRLWCRHATNYGTGTRPTAVAHVGPVRAVQSGAADRAGDLVGRIDGNSNLQHLESDDAADGAGINRRGVSVLGDSERWARSVATQPDHRRGRKSPGRMPSERGFSTKRAARATLVAAQNYLILRWFVWSFAAGEHGINDSSVASSVIFLGQVAPFGALLAALLISGVIAEHWFWLDVAAGFALLSYRLLIDLPTSDYPEVLRSLLQAYGIALLPAAVGYAASLVMRKWPSRG